MKIINQSTFKHIGRASLMAQRVKVLAVKPEDLSLSLVSGIHMVEGDN